MDGAREKLFYVSIMGLLSTKAISTIDSLVPGNSFWIAVLTLLVLGIYFGANTVILSRCTDSKQELPSESRDA